MIWNAARGGMRSVVEAYRRDGFIEAEKIRLIASYDDGGFAARQLLLVRSLALFVWLLMTRRVELVHCHAAMRGSFWRKGFFSSLARLFGVPVLLHLHGSEMKPFYASQRPAVQRMIRRHLERAHRVIVLSESWRTFIASVAPAARVVVVPNYVRLPPERPVETRNADQLLFLGLVGPRKGTFDLVEAFAAVHAAHPAARLVIGGNGEVEKAGELVARHGLGAAIELAGWVDGPARQRLLDAAGIYVLPSYNEGLPMSVLEAMAEGLAVVTTRVGGIPELVTDGVDGLLIEPGDKAELSRALGRLLGDEALRVRIAEAGRRRVADHYSDRVVLPMLHALYRETEAGRVASAPLKAQ